MLAFVLGAAAVGVFIAGPLTWWLTPAEVDQLAPVDRLRAEADVRDSLMPLVLAGVIVAGIYAPFAVLSHFNRRQPYRSQRAMVVRDLAGCVP